MSKKQKQKLIAQAYGWTDISESHDDLVGYFDGMRGIVPNYFEDLNAIAEAKMHCLNLGSGVGSVYKFPKELEAIVERDRHSSYEHVAFATAEQHTEALGKTLNLW
jgi:hypothetical protein